MATKMYHINGMHCNGCVNTVKNVLKEMDGVLGVQVQLEEPQAIISMQQDIAIDRLQKELAEAGDYSIQEMEEPADASMQEPKKSKLESVLSVFHRKKDCCK